MASAKDLLCIFEVSEIEIKVEDFVETQEDCIKLLTEELEENTSRAAYFKKIQAPIPNVNTDWYSCEQSPSSEISDQEIEFFIQVGPGEERICPFEVAFGVLQGNML